MGSPTAMRAFRSLQPSICASCRSSLPNQSLAPLRPFSSSVRSHARDASPRGSLDQTLGAVAHNFKRASDDFGNMIPPSGKFANLVKQEWEEDLRHHLHIYSHKHNTHITLSKPNRDSLISVSCGNIGFRKAGRGTYDAAYQLAAFVMSRIQDKGLLPDIEKLELIYRGFGPGREAVTKAILGSEGKYLRDKIVKLSDSTRLKFGGTRSKKPRRLG
ncbi:hypothetical protein BDV95DRAFT_504280 [Massariosphaeria phaeospora]|uniref:Small ribosomal subunit protein uS11m n=1 Tax=Massariosphaeria phaeospora TaxID=100035 RepID=A0A7C8M8S9_9PLEO|nr:hypothetical protein BDV95DRAFT_504280 [Massariosphaeria phaeospora]